MRSNRDTTGLWLGVPVAPRGAILLIAAPVLCALLLAGAARASEGMRIEALEDPSGALQIGAIAATPSASGWTPLPGPRFAARISPSAWWLRIELPAPASPAERLLFLDGAQIDVVRFFVRDATAPDGWQRHVSGDRVPTDAKTLRDAAHAFPLPADTGPVYLRLTSEGSLGTRIEIVEREAFLAERGREEWQMSIYTTFLVALALYHFVLLLASRDLAYLGFVLFLTSMATFGVANGGYAGLWVQSEGSAASGLASSFGGTFSFLGAQLLVATFSGMTTLPRWIAVPSWVFIGITAMVVPWIAIDLPGVLRYGIPLHAAAASWQVVPIVAALKRRRPQSLFQLVTWLLVLPPVLIWQLEYIGVWNPTFDALTVLRGAFALQALLLAFAFATRTRELARAKRAAEAQLAEEQKNISQHLLRAQDDERQRIARHLHDSLGQPLLALSNRVERHLDETPLRAQLLDLVRTSLDETRKISRELHPHRLDLVGLADALRDLVTESFASSAIDATIEVDPVQHLSRGQQLHLYRIAQEAIANVLRHSGAQQAHISLKQNATHLRLEVSDDGQGMAHPRLGIGLSSIAERAKALDATLQAANDAGGGFRVAIRMPL